MLHKVVFFELMRGGLAKRGISVDNLTPLLFSVDKPSSLKVKHVSDAPLVPSSLPTGGRPEVLSGCLFEQRDVSALRVQPRLGPDGTRREAAGQACRAAFGVKGNLAEQIPLPARRAAPAMQTIIRAADSTHK